MKNFTLLFAAIFTLVLTSCQKVSMEDFHITELNKEKIDQVENVSLKQNIAQFIQEDANFSLFHDALVHTDLDYLLSTGDNITVFAPNNDAMKKLMLKGLFTTVEEIEVSYLKEIMMCHISISGEHFIDATARGKEVETLLKNQNVYMSTADISVTLGKSTADVYVANRQQTNGIIHQISSFLMPQ